MSQACRQFRDDWFEASAKGDSASAPRPEMPETAATPAGTSPRPHVDTCSACKEWVASVERHARILCDVERPCVPVELDARVEWLLGEEVREVAAQPRAVRALRMLPEMAAPAELETALFGRAEAGGELAGVALPQLEPWCVQGLRSLPMARAPHVLDRLVGEELADPSAALARRFAGDLERQAAPAGLAARVRREIALRYRPSLVRVVAPFATLAAAVLFVWIGLTGSGEEGNPQPYSFRVTYVESEAELAGFARSLGSVIGGGAPVRGVKAAETRPSRGEAR